MRFVLGLLALLFAATPASAQSRLYASCMTSAEGDGALSPAVAQSLCTCAETRVLSGGETEASVDRYLTYAEGLNVGPSGMAEVDDAPEWARATSSVLVGAVTSCVTDLQRRAYAESDDPDVPAVVSTGAPEAGGAAVTGGPAGTTAAGASRPALPAGLRTGDGTAPVQTRQMGKGAALRIVG